MQHWIPLSLRWRARRRQQGAGGGPAALRSTSARRLARRRRTSSHSGSSYNNSSDPSASSACVLVSRCETNALLPGLRDGPDDGIPGSLDDDRGSGTPSTSSQTELSTFTPRYLHHAIAGATAGAVVEALLFPIDTIKTRLQSGNFLPSVKSGRHDSSLKAVMDSHLARQKLFHRPLAGVTPAVLGAMPSSALFVGSYEPTKSALLNLVQRTGGDVDKWSSACHLGAAAFASCVSAIVRTPTEVLKQQGQMAVQGTPTFELCRDLVRKSGLRGLYQGGWSMLMRDIPFNVIEFVTYEQLRRSLKNLKSRPSDQPELTSKESALIGCMAGALTGALTCPLDMLKTRMMLNEMAGKAWWQAVREIVSKEGPAVFLSGIGPRVVWIGVGGSIFFATLDIMEKSLLAYTTQRENDASKKVRRKQNQQQQRVTLEV